MNTRKQRKQSQARAAAKERKKAFRQEFGFNIKSVFRRFGLWASYDIRAHYTKPVRTIKS